MASRAIRQVLDLLAEEVPGVEFEVRHAPPNDYGDAFEVHPKGPGRRESLTITQTAVIEGTMRESIARFGEELLAGEEPSPPPSAPPALPEGAMTRAEVSRLDQQIIDLERDVERLTDLLHETHGALTDGVPVPRGRWLMDGGPDRIPQDARDLREAYEELAEEEEARSAN